MEKKKMAVKENLFGELIENNEYLSEQLITYLGNKRSLLDFIETAIDIVKSDLKKDRLVIADLFSGSGVVSRFFKKYSSVLIVNDLEPYTYVINKCYLTNYSQLDVNLISKCIKEINNKIEVEGFKRGFIQDLYAPKDDTRIEMNERVFFTTRNAKYIDTARQIINEYPSEIRPYLLAPLLSEASIKNNTSGVFKGFYKNTLTGKGEFGGNNKDALKRIMGEITLKLPILSNFDSEVFVYNEDTNSLATKLKDIDLVYLDPPYNQHPYGSNYFMLNLINDYNEPTDLSRVSGIPNDWNRSNYNKKGEAYNSLEALVKSLDAKFILISFNSEGFISKELMLKLLNQIGEVTVLETKYNTYRGSRNLKDRDKHLKEYLYLVKKEKL